MTKPVMQVTDDDSERPTDLAERRGNDYYLELMKTLGSLLNEKNIQATKQGQRAAELGKFIIESRSISCMEQFSTLAGSRIQQILKSGETKAKKPSNMITGVWKSFHKLRFSREICESWQNLLASLDGATPILVSEENLLCQMLLDRLMKSNQVDQLHNDSPSASSQQPTTLALSSREKNAVRYIAGYIIRKLKDKYKVKNKDSEIQKRNERYIHILTQMQTDHQLEYSSYEDDTREWTELLDRGGLFHVTNEAYQILEQIELKTKYFLKQAGVQLSDPIQVKIISSVLKDTHIMRQWNVMSGAANEELLTEITKLWTTVRCFAFAKNWNDKVIHDKFQKHGTRKTLK